MPCVDQLRDQHQAVCPAVLRANCPVNYCRAFLCTPAKATTYVVGEALAAHEATALLFCVTVLSLRVSVLMQLCIPGLENRAVLFPPLTHSTELAPGRHHVLVTCACLRLWLYADLICPCICTVYAQLNTLAKLHFEVDA